jgi:hypothetical protein
MIDAAIPPNAPEIIPATGGSPLATASARLSGSATAATVMPDKMSAPRCLPENTSLASAIQCPRASAIASL